MEKTEAVSKLKKAGYQVQFDSSVVTVVLPSKANTNQEIKKLRSVLQEMGYDASFGIKQVKELNNKEEKTEENEKMNAIEKDFGETVLDNPTDDRSEKSDKGLEEPRVEIGEQFSLEDFGIS